jgi:hypothetical protein
LLGDFPLLGYAVAAAVWLFQRGIQMLAARQVKEELSHGERQRAMGIVAGTGLGRVWLIAAVVLVVGLAVDKDAGLAAAVLLVILFTLSMGAQAYRHLFGEGAARRARGRVA